MNQSTPNLNQSRPDYNKAINKLLLIIISVVGIYCFVLDYFARNNISSGLVFSSSLIVLLGGLIINFLIRSEIPLDVFGLTLNKWKLAIKESFVWSLSFIALAVLAKFLYAMYDSELSKLPLLSFDVFSDLGYLKSIVFLLVYVALSIIQEIIRCVIQGGLQVFFEPKYNSAKSILLTSLLFSSFHLIVNPYFAYGAFFIGIFWGLLYARTPSIIGVTFSHIILGVFFFYFGYFPIADLVKL